MKALFAKSVYHVLYSRFYNCGSFSWQSFYAPYQQNSIVCRQNTNVAETISQCQQQKWIWYCHALLMALSKPTRKTFLSYYCAFYSIAFYWRVGGGGGSSMICISPAPPPPHFCLSGHNTILYKGILTSVGTILYSNSFKPIAEGVSCIALQKLRSVLIIAWS